jgi:hypothetical protein
VGEKDAFGLRERFWIRLSRKEVGVAIVGELGGESLTLLIVQKFVSET